MSFSRLEVHALQGVDLEVQRNEYLAAVHSASGKAIVGIFEELHAAGQTIVMITHDMGLARLASRIVQIRDGRIEEDTAAAA